MAAAVARPASRRLAEIVPSNVVADIYRYSFKKQTGVSLKYMMAHGAYPTERNLLLSAQFLQHELPVRLAHRVTELENLPYGLSTKSPVLKVRDWYVDSFKDIRSFPEIRGSPDELRFTELIHQIKMRHNNVMPTMAMGISELKQDLGQKVGLDNLPEIHQFLDRFYMSRIGIRMLIGQHVALHQPSPPPGYIGYVPTHLHQMLFELVKNSLRAVQERFMDADHDAPPIRVVVADGIEDVTVKISDEGGGIPRSGLPKIWTYLYSTAKSPVAEGQIQDMPNVMAGYGYGLPISRLYARYFGGDLQVVSMEGYGTDVYLHLNRLGNVQEPLP